MGPTALLPFRRKSYSGFLRSEKIHRPWPGLNPRTLNWLQIEKEILTVGVLIEENVEYLLQMEHLET